MYNISMVMFNEYRYFIDAAARRGLMELKSLFCEANIRGQYNIFCLYEQKQILMSRILCNMLSKKYTDCISSSPDIVKDMEKSIALIVAAFINVHNAFVLCKSSTNSSYDIRRLRCELSNCEKAFGDLCMNLISIANPIHVLFPKVCTCVKGMMICMKKLVHRCDIVLRQSLCSEKSSTNVGVRSCFSTVIVDPTRAINPMPGFAEDVVLLCDFEIFDQKLEEICANVRTVQLKFLLEGMEKRYKFSFENLLVCMSNAAISNSEKKPLVGGAQLLVSYDGGFVVKPGFMENRECDPNSASTSNNSTCEEISQHNKRQRMC